MRPIWLEDEKGDIAEAERVNIEDIKPEETNIDNTSNGCWRYNLCEEVQANDTNLIPTMAGSRSINKKNNSYEHIAGKMGEAYFWNLKDMKVKDIEVKGIKLDWAIVRSVSGSVEKVEHVSEKMLCRNNGKGKYNGKEIKPMLLGMASKQYVSH
jgi:hypothetical protein